MKIDPHVHTRFSEDSWSEISEIIATAKRRGLDGIAVTDHDTLEGYNAFSRMQTDIEVIPGVERTIPVGEHGLHVIGLCIETLPPAESMREMIADVKSQGGRVIIPHPFRRGTGLLYHLENENISDDEASYALEKADYVELINWKDPNPIIQRTIEFLQGRSCSIVAGSDSHVPETVGSVFTQFPSRKIGGECTAHAYVQKPLPDTTDFGTHLIGHDQNSEREDAKRQLKTLVASALNLIPGPEPNRTLKRLQHHTGKSLRRRKFERQIDQCQLAELQRDREEQDILVQNTDT